MIQISYIKMNKWLHYHYFDKKSQKSVTIQCMKSLITIEKKQKKHMI